MLCLQTVAGSGRVLVTLPSVFSLFSWKVMTTILSTGPLNRENEWPTFCDVLTYVVFMIIIFMLIIQNKICPKHLVIMCVFVNCVFSTAQSTTLQSEKGNKNPEPAASTARPPLRSDSSLVYWRYRSVSVRRM